MTIKAIYDNGGRTVDRYTVIFTDGSALGLSDNPEFPQGFSQWVDAVEGKHLGNHLELEDLPENVRKHFERRAR